MVIAGLALIMSLTLLLPFSVKRVEEELEAFLLVMGSLAAGISGVWTLHLLQEALTEPVKITLAVLFIGFVFRYMRRRIRTTVDILIKSAGRPLAVFIMTIALGLASSVITAIIAALVLAEIVTALQLDRKYEVRFTVCACLAIGLGAALTPIGEPLATIAVSKLRGPPHNADFFYLLRMLWFWIIPGILVCAAAASWKIGRRVSESKSLCEDAPEKDRDIVLRAVKVYIFVAALVLLGAGLSPLAEKSLVSIPTWALYWINSVSAVLDNATLVAAEIVPSMSRGQITFLLMGLIISGGMLIPGNIPNIISASKLGIKSREWAAVGVPLVAAMMAVYFAALMLVL
ncbi:MAG: DUF1646 family protein [bacterium]